MSLDQTCRFEDKRNITVHNYRNDGRIIWAKECYPVTGNIKHCPEGWVLPGGERTHDRDRATAAAYMIANN